MIDKVFHWIKRPGGNILSNLHRIIDLFSYIQIKSSILIVLEHRSLKNWLNSTRAFHTNSSNNWKELGVDTPQKHDKHDFSCRANFPNDFLLTLQCLRHDYLIFNLLIHLWITLTFFISCNCPFDFANFPICNWTNSKSPQAHNSTISILAFWFSFVLPLSFITMLKILSKKKFLNVHKIKVVPNKLPFQYRRSQNINFFVQLWYCLYPWIVSNGPSFTFGKSQINSHNWFTFKK